MILKDINSPKYHPYYYIVDDTRLNWNIYIITNSLKLAKKIDQIAKKFPTFENFYKKYREILDKMEYYPKSYKHPQRYCIALIERELKSKK